MKLAARIALALALLGAAGLAAREAIRSEVARRVLDDPRAAVEPAPLSPLHAARAELADCSRCHSMASAVGREGCLDCHEEIRDRLLTGRGHHGRDLTGECRDCHAEHRPSIVDLDRASFNHRQALFALEGRHAELDCDECHEREGRIRYVGLAFETCVDCHADPHRGELTRQGKDCVTCHDQIAWDGKHLLFRHDRNSRFALAGRHAAADCEGCHEPPGEWSPLGAARFVGTPTACASCHVDPHQGQFRGSDCTSCHDEHGFAGADLLFRHETFEPFHLRGAHAGVPCAKCHPPAEGAALASATFRGLPHDCASCHEDPHQRQFAGTACETCHAEEGFTGRTVLFSHAEFPAFPLRNAHAEVPCAGCHRPAEGSALASATFRGLGHDCATCHEDPHRGQFAGTACEACHDEHGFRGRNLLFSHASFPDFPLRGEHGAVPCAGCHRPPEGATLAAAPFRDLAADCASCHQDPHRGQFEGKACRTCHDEKGFKSRFLLFSHDRSGFQLTGAHVRVACARCHEKEDGVVRFRRTPEGCVDCHTDPHSGSFEAAECATCHTTAGWSEGHLTFDHQTSRFPLDAAHRSLACSSCHSSFDFRKAPTTCDGCHVDVAGFLAGRIAVGRAQERVEEDPHAGRVTCAQCHDTTREAHQSLESYAARCAGCHTPRYADLYLERTAHLASLAHEGRRLAGEALDPELEAFLRVGTHDYAPAEKRVRARVEALRR